VDKETRTVTADATTAEDLAMIRRHVLEICTSAGLDHDRCSQLGVAANEITANAIQYGGGHARVVITADITEISVEIHDRGPGILAVKPERPEPTAPHGRGLWLADQLCDSMQVSSTARGTSIRLVMNR
jgi:anti-sigma regulatory factor (Ser/Thr protein kinase)